MSEPTVAVKGNNLVITIPMEKKPYLSSTKKSRIVATTSGFFKSETKVKGSPVTINAFAIIKA